MKTPDTIRQMARLREQARLIKVMREYHGTALVGDQGSSLDRNKQQLAAAVGAIQEVDLITYLAKNDGILKEDFERTGAFPAVGSLEYQHRKAKVAELYRACVDDNFIAPRNIDIQQTNMSFAKLFAGMQVTSRGSDLLGWWGFSRIFFEKHSKQIAFIWGALSTIGIGLVGWVLTHLDQVRHLLHL